MHLLHTKYQFYLQMRVAPAINYRLTVIPFFLEGAIAPLSEAHDCNLSVGLPSLAYSPPYPNIGASRCPIRIRSSVLRSMQKQPTSSCSLLMPVYLITITLYAHLFLKRTEMAVDMTAVATAPKKKWMSLGCMLLL